MLLNYCIYIEDSYKSLDATTLPEVQRSSMAPVVLQLKALGIDNVLRFDYLSVSNWILLFLLSLSRALSFFHLPLFL